MVMNFSKTLVQQTVTLWNEDDTRQGAEG